MFLAIVQMQSPVPFVEIQATWQLIASFLGIAGLCMFMMMLMIRITRMLLALLLLLAILLLVIIKPLLLRPAAPSSCASSAVSVSASPSALPVLFFTSPPASSAPVTSPDLDLVVPLSGFRGPPPVPPVDLLIASALRHSKPRIKPKPIGRQPGWVDNDHAPPSGKSSKSSVVAPRRKDNNSSCVFDRRKENLAFDYVRSSDVNVCFVQEILLSDSSVLRSLVSRWRGPCFWSPSIGRQGETLTLWYFTSGKDAAGRVVSLLVQSNAFKINLINIYVPTNFTDRKDFTYF